MSRVTILVVDGFGIGHAPDAEKFGDVSANTFANLADAFTKEKGRALNIPKLTALGLVAACQQASGRTLATKTNLPVKGAFGYCRQISTGKDTPSGHWEMAGVPVLFDWGYFNNRQESFPKDLIDKINQATGYNGILGNCHASGTDIIAALGAEHIKTGLPICYTSADSVFQVAAHEEHFGLDNLYRYCEQVRELLGELNIGRVIARPFIGETPQDFTRTGNRRDYSILPPAPTMLDKLTEHSGKVISIGKIADIFAHQGISEKYKATGLPALIDETITQLTKPVVEPTIIFTNLVNFDQDFGHRRNPVGYGDALEYLDSRMQEIFTALTDDDVLFITSDHGCDPTWHGSDHTREYVPVLVYHHKIGCVDLGERTTFADIGQTIVDYFALPDMAYGESFLTKLNLS